MTQPFIYYRYSEVTSCEKTMMMAQRQRVEAKSQQVVRWSGVQCASTQDSSTAPQHHGAEPTYTNWAWTQHLLLCITQSDLYWNTQKVLLPLFRTLFRNGIPIPPEFTDVFCQYSFLLLMASYFFCSLLKTWILPSCFIPAVLIYGIA